MNTSQSIIFIMGVSGSGKSTIGKLLAESLKTPFFDGDDYHSKKNVQKMAEGHPLTDEDRQDWLKNLNALAKKNEKNGAVIACSALKTEYRATLRKDLAKKVNFIYLKGTFEEISKRLEQRKGHFMPPGLLRSQFEALEDPKEALIQPISDTPERIVTAIIEKLKV